MIGTEFPGRSVGYVPKDTNRKCDRCGKVCKDWKALEEHRADPFIWCQSIEEKRAPSYYIFHPNYPGQIAARVFEDGRVEEKDGTWHLSLSSIIDAICHGGHFTEAAFNLRCVPDRTNKYGNLVAKKKDCTTLGKLFGPKKKRGVDQSGLITISEKNRFKGRDWETKRDEITQLLSKGLSLGKIARHFGVSPSTLSEANKRHGLYTPKQPVA